MLHKTETRKCIVSNCMHIDEKDSSPHHPPTTTTHNPFAFSFRNAAKKWAKEESRPWWFMDTVCDLASVNSDTAKWADTAAHLLSDHFSWFLVHAGLLSFPTASPQPPPPGTSVSASKSLSRESPASQQGLTKSYRARPLSNIAGCARPIVGPLLTVDTVPLLKADKHGWIDI